MNNDWFEANSATLTPAIEERRAVHLEYKRSPSQRTLQEYRFARSKVQRLARQCANDYWLQLCWNIQLSADTGNIRGMYDGIKKAMGPTKKWRVSLKSATGENIQDKGKQMDRWVEHYSEVYSRQNTITEAALNTVDGFPVEIELDEKPTVEELKKVIESLSTGKAPGKDGIPPEVIKCGINVLLEHLHDLLCQCWDEGAVPQDMRDANIVTLYKNKGDRSDCNNYRGISLLSVVGKDWLPTEVAESQRCMVCDQGKSTSQQIVAEAFSGPFHRQAFFFHYGVRPFSRQELPTEEEDGVFVVFHHLQKYRP
ncbi:uncharacterized protein RBU57_002249 [Macrochelys suwanniensis]